MAHRLLRDAQADGWERSDFPIICESCLGDNPYVRMMKADYDKECKICARPFTVFRWRPGRDARYKKTEICQTCCKLKNVCQVCLLDLEYGLPVQVRDTALALNSNDAIPKSDVNREYFAEEHDRKARAGIDYESTYGKAKPNDTILKLQRTTPYYKRNRAHVCSFFIRGECTRGEECPYRHEMPETGELSQQNIKDRYYGVNDPVALKLLGKAGEMPSLQPPEDESIRTLYVGGLDARVSEQDLRDQFYAHGEIETIRMVPQRSIAFVTYTTREAAENAAEELANKLVVKGLRLKLMWGRPQQQRGDEAGPVAHGGLLPRAVISQQNAPAGGEGEGGEGSGGGGGGGNNYFNIPERVQYPSMDPQRMGAVIRGEGESSKGSGSGTGTGTGTGQGYYPPPPPQQYYQGGGQYGQYYAPPPVPGQHMQGYHGQAPMPPAQPYGQGPPPMMYAPQNYLQPQYRPVPAQHHMGPPPPHQQNMGPPPPQQNMGPPPPQQQNMRPPQAQQNMGPPPAQQQLNDVAGPSQS